MGLSQQDKLDLLNQAIKDVGAEYTLRPISPEYATAIFMVFAAILQRWFNQDDADLAAFIAASKKLDMTTTSAKNLSN
jgi:hypothetical protein